MSGITVRERPAKIHAIEFTGTNLQSIAEWLGRHTTIWTTPKLEQYPGEQLELVVGDARFCAGDFLVATEGRLSRFTRQKFEATFEVVE